MTKRLLILITLLASAALARDWSKYTAVVVIDRAAVIYAVGDAHSDFVRLSAALRGAGIIDKDENWLAGNAVLVSTGDMIDKGPRALDVIRLLRKLRDAAPAKGGQVVILSGNHESEFMADPSVPKVREFVAQLKAAGIKAADVAACKGDLGEFFCSIAFAARVGDTFFSHAGNTAGRTVAQLEADIEKDFDKHGFSAQQLIGDGSVIEARLNGTGKGREVWLDAGLPKVSEAQLLTNYTKALGVTRIVEGHVPSEVRFADSVTRGTGEMFQRFGSLYLIDTGMSEGVDNSLGAVLHLTTGTATAICPDGKRTQLWDAASHPDTGRAKPCGK